MNIYDKIIWYTNKSRHIKINSKQISYWRKLNVKVQYRNWQLIEPVTKAFYYIFKITWAKKLMCSNKCWILHHIECMLFAWTHFADAITTTKAPSIAYTINHLGSNPFVCFRTSVMSNSSACCHYNSRPYIIIYHEYKFVYIFILYWRRFVLRIIIFFIHILSIFM